MLISADFNQGIKQINATIRLALHTQNRYRAKVEVFELQIQWATRAEIDPIIFACEILFYSLKTGKCGTISDDNEL